jgi:hypothetical protein
LAKQELFNNEAQIKIYHMEQNQYEQQKKEAQRNLLMFRKK